MGPWQTDTQLMCFSFWKNIKELSRSTASQIMCYCTEAWTLQYRALKSSSHAACRCLRWYPRQLYSHKLQVPPESTNLSGLCFKHQDLKHRKHHVIFQVHFRKILKAGDGTTFVLKTRFLKVNNTVIIQTIIYSLKRDTSVNNYFTVKVIFNF